MPQWASAYDRHGRDLCDRTPTTEDGRELLRYGRTSCHHDFYNQNAVQKVQRNFINSQNVGFLPQKVRHYSGKILLYAIQPPTKFNT